MAAETGLAPTPASTLTLTVAATAQNVFAALKRRSWMIQNQSPEVMYVRTDGTAATQDENSVKIPPGYLARNEPNTITPSIISIIGPTAGQAFHATEQVGIIVEPAGGPVEMSGYDSSVDAIQVEPIAASPRATMTVPLAQLTAPGDSAPIDVSLYEDHTVFVTIAAIETNVVVGIKTSGNGTDFGRISLADPANQVVGCAIDEEQATITANGTYPLRFSGQIKEIMVTFESEDPGTAVTVDPVYVGGAS